MSSSVNNANYASLYHTASTCAKPHQSVLTMSTRVSQCHLMPMYASLCQSFAIKWSLTKIDLNVHKRANEKPPYPTEDDGKQMPVSTMMFHLNISLGLSTEV